MKGLLDYIHFIGLASGVVLACDAIGNLQTIGHNVVGELLTSLALMVASFIAFTIKKRF